MYSAMKWLISRTFKAAVEFNLVSLATKGKKQEQ